MTKLVCDKCLRKVAHGFSVEPVIDLSVRQTEPCFVCGTYNWVFLARVEQVVAHQLKSNHDNQ